MRLAGSIWVLLLVFLTGCGAAYSRYMGGTLKRLGNRDYEAALEKLEKQKPEGQTNKLLYRLEKGLILHYQGMYEESNREFEKAERLIDRLFTRSISREVASLVTNDAIRAYRGEEFERVLINYYRALNYQYLKDGQAALVECRKANLKLEDYAQASEYELSYKNDAFLQYITGLFYEAEGEWNDAYVSYKDAVKGYRAYQKTFGLRMPRMLARDLARMAQKLGYEYERAEYIGEYGLKPEELAPGPGGEVILFVESGFIARKHQIELDLPILEDDDTREVWMLSDRLVYRYRHPYVYRRYRVDYWLKVALPEYREMPSKVRSIRLSGGGQKVTAVSVEDLSAIALRNFEEKFDTVLLRTAARALAKYLISRGVEKAFEEDGDGKGEIFEGLVREGMSELLGALVNLFGAATEAADTRSWLSLPARIHVARLWLPPGTVDLVLEFLDERGRTVEVQQIPGVEVSAGRPVFLNYRGYR